MNKTDKKKFTSLCEKWGWEATYDGEDNWTIRKFSPEGEDWTISLSGSTISELADDLNNYYESLDPEEHAAEIYNAKHSGSEDARRFYADAPDSLRALLEDAEDMQSEVHALCEALYRACE